MIKVQRALISVSDKTGVVEFAKFLHKQGVKILSTGGTLKALQEGGVDVQSIESYTGSPEMMDGRLKTLHPKIHGGLLALRDKNDHVNSLVEHKIEPIDLLIVNLYPFAQTVARNAPFEEVIENIDIGGPTMLRAAAKNYRFVASVCNPLRYDEIQKSISAEGGIDVKLSLELAREVFNHTAQYDALIASYLNEKSNDRFPDKLTLPFQKIGSLRYGENPHQAAAFYHPALELEKNKVKGIDSSVQLNGKELSFNNMLDLSSAMEAALSLPGKGVVIVKHLNPCGAAWVKDESQISSAFAKARLCDPVSAFGGVIAFASSVDQKSAELIIENFAEGVIAPSFSDEALRILSSKKNLRVIRVNEPELFLKESMEIRQVYNGILYQQSDRTFAGSKFREEWKVVTKVKPDAATLDALEFAWRLVRHIKSNAILFTSEDMTLAVGAGQMSRVDSVEIAVMKAAKNNMSLKGSLVASDAFFPFRDGLDALAKAGARAVIQPGGSVRDAEVIEAADEHGIAMLFTGMRHFRH